MQSLLLCRQIQALNNMNMYFHQLILLFIITCTLACILAISCRSSVSNFTIEEHAGMCATINAEQKNSPNKTLDRLNDSPQKEEIEDAVRIDT